MYSDLPSIAIRPKKMYNKAVSTYLSTVQFVPKN